MYAVQPTRLNICGSHETHMTSSQSTAMVKEIVPPPTEPQGR